MSETTEFDATEFLIPEDIRKIANGLAFEFAVAALERPAEQEIAQAIWAERQRCAKIADDWIKIFGASEIGSVSAREYAVDAVKDISQAILADKEES